MKSTTGQYSYRQVVMAITTRRRVGDDFCKASHTSIVTSPKPLTDKPHHKQTSHKDKHTSLEHVPNPSQLIVFVGRYLESGSRIGIHITLYKPPSPVMCHSFTHLMTGTHQEHLLDHLRVLLFFIELNILLYTIISRNRRQQNPAPAQPASPSPPPPPRRRKPQKPWVMPWILQREERGCYKTLLDELITTYIPGYRKFTRMQPAFGVGGTWIGIWIFVIGYLAGWTFVL